MFSITDQYVLALSVGATVLEKIATEVRLEELLSKKLSRTLGLFQQPRVVSYNREKSPRGRCHFPSSGSVLELRTVPLSSILSTLTAKLRNPSIWNGRCNWSARFPVFLSIVSKRFDRDA